MQSRLSFGVIRFSIKFKPLGCEEINLIAKAIVMGMFFEMREVEKWKRKPIFSNDQLMNLTAEMTLKAIWQPFFPPDLTPVDS